MPIFPPLSQLLTLVAALLLVFGQTSAQANQSSSSLILVDKNQLFSANFDGGSITRTDLKSIDQPIEKALGRDIRRLAITDDGKLIAASAYLDGRIYILDAQSLEVVNSFKTGRRPFAILFDAANQLFWATLFEDHQIIAFDRQGNVLQQVDTVDTPRGLALTDDGRLLVTHAMTGQVSIYSTQQGNLSLLKRIDLAEEQNPDQFVSQGLPRLLDDIAISPDGNEAWLPHLLWNFDHP
ncbi:MAG: hypothetical protein OQK12_13150, partial [Motiliproteus sp.]|nr:hypothetical protein [Motiliproteus sp.]